MKWNFHEISDNVWERWLNLSRWVLVKALIELWLVLSIDFPLERVASLKMSAHSTVGKQSSSKVFSPFKFWGWQITHLSLAPINMTQTSSLLHRNIFSLQHWLEWTPVFRRSTHIDCENVNLISLNGATSFSRQVTSKPRCSAVHRVSLQEALENGSAPP